MPLALTAADLAAAPTGAAVTVSGSGGQAVAVSARSADPAGPPPAWRPAGSLTGDGTLTVPLAAGAWWLFALAADGTPAGPALVLVTTGLEAVPTRCRHAAAARIAGLGLLNPADGLPLPVVEQLYPDPTKVPSYPCVILSVEDGSEAQEPGVNAFDDVGYPVVVQIQAREGTPPDHASLPVYEGWRYRIAAAFRNQRLPGVPESVMCRVEPLAIAEPDLLAYHLLVGGLVVRAVCRVPRGVAV